MAKIQREPIPFIPYILTIESQKEHDFLEGLFYASEGEAKERCRNFDSTLDKEFHALIKSMEK
jgi:hypothetical protein